jgi:hypothetical protein
MNKTPLAIRLESMTMDNLKACAFALFENHEDGASDAFDAVLQELEIRMGDDFAEWADANF